MPREKLMFTGTVAFLSIASFLLCFYIFSLSEPGIERRTAETKADTLSGKEYSTAGIYNYRDSNPYGSYFVGFESIRDSGVTNGEMLYINDVLINFTMYNKKIYNGKISYVNNSLELLEEENTKKPGQKRYSFDFGINDGNIHTMSITSNWLEDMITIKIANQSGKEVFNKSFTIHPTPSS
jgi:hypothetical protein